MRFERCANIACRRPYQVNEFDFGGFCTAASNADAFNAEQYICPHCGHTQAASGNSIVLVHALTEEQEQEFNRANPLRERVKATRRR
jgi:hypothetical protein